MVERTPFGIRVLFVMVLTITFIQYHCGMGGHSLSIENDSLRVTYRPDSAAFAVAARPSGQVFLQGRLLAHPGSRVERTSVTDEVWGKGQMLLITEADSLRESIKVFPGVPFVRFQSTIKNGTDHPVVRRSIQPVHLSLHRNKPAGVLRTLGTAGLKRVSREDNPGSYSFLAVADPESRRGVVTGWLTQNRGSGVIFSDLQDGTPVLDGQLDFGRLEIPPGESVPLETFLVGRFQDARLGLEAYADAVARQSRISLPPQPTVYCTWYHARASNQQDLLANAVFAKRHLSPYGFTTLQIDDGWQAGLKDNGPKKNFTTSDPNGPYPYGMKQTADAIKRLGLMPGIWFMPFAGTRNDPFFADKQDLFATKDGKPFEVRWGGTCFDLTNPATQDYVRSVVRRIARDWGYQYFKLDGLWTGMAARIEYIQTGYKDDHLGEARLHDPLKTNIEAYRDGLRLVREAAGNDVFLLGCNVAQNMRTLGASFGLLDAMRIGPDNGPRWEAMRRGPFSGSTLYFLNGRVWYNDPDPVYVRKSVPLNQARALLSWVTISGQLNSSSYQYADLPPERLNLLQRAMPSHGLTARPVDLFEHRIPRIWLLKDPRTAVPLSIVGLFNWAADSAQTIRYPMEKIGLSGTDEYVGFNYWDDSFVSPFSGELHAVLPGASCRVLALRPAADIPRVIGTSRHITQGVLDLKAEEWDAGNAVLSGASEVVGGDLYELRLAAMRPDQPWQVVSLGVDEPAQQADVAIKLVSQEDWKVRVLITSPENRTVRWRIRFR